MKLRYRSFLSKEEGLTGEKADTDYAEPGSHMDATLCNPSYSNESLSRKGPLVLAREDRKTYRLYGLESNKQKNGNYGKVQRRLEGSRCDTYIIGPLRFASTTSSPTHWATTRRRKETTLSSAISFEKSSTCLLSKAIVPACPNTEDAPYVENCANQCGTSYT